MLLNTGSGSRLAILSAVAAVAINLSAVKAANTTVTLTSFGTFSGLTGLSSDTQEDTLNITGLPPTDKTTTAFLFPTLGATDTWGISGNNGWVIIDAFGGASVAAVVHFDNVTDIGSTPFETLYFYGPGNLPPSADYTYSGSNPPDDTVTITENVNGIATYDPTSGQPGFGYDATGSTPTLGSSGGTQVFFAFGVPDGASTLYLLGVTLAALAGVRRRIFAS